MRTKHGEKVISNGNCFRRLPAVVKFSLFSPAGAPWSSKSYRESRVEKALSTVGGGVSEFYLATQHHRRCEGVRRCHREYHTPTKATEAENRKRVS